MEIIKEFTLNEFRVQIEKVEKPVFGGFYQVSSYCNDICLMTVNGYCLDAAIEVFNISKKGLNAIKVKQLS